VQFDKGLISLIMRAYEIYGTLQKGVFEILKSKLDTIVSETEASMMEKGFFLNRRDYGDLLTVDYTHADSMFYGNIGLAYLGDKSSMSNHFFEHYILKAHDKNKNRYYIKETSPTLYLIDELKGIALTLFKTSIKRYESLEVEDLTNVIQLKF